MAKETKELATVSNDDAFFDSVFGKQLETQEMKFNRNPRISVISSGSKPKFEIPGKNDATEIEVIIVSNILGNEYRNPKTNPDIPDCYSIGGENGTRFGKCVNCKYNSDWHTDANGRKNKSCTSHDKLAVIFANEDDATMYEIRVTKASRKNLAEYLKGLTNDRIGLSQVVTRLSLEKVNEQGGIRYSRIRFNAGEPTIAVHKEHAEYNIRVRLEEALKKLSLFFKLTPECENPQEPGSELENAKPKNLVVKEEEASIVEAPKVAEIIQAEDDETVPF